MNIQLTDLNKIKLTDLNIRPSKIHVDMLGKAWQCGGSLTDFIDKLPRILAANKLRTAAEAISKAYQNKRPFILGIGGHVIKVGLSPIIIDALEHGLITGLALNGATMIHDVEMALIGHTSENVAKKLTDGSYGTSRQTGEFINNAIISHSSKNLGLGLAVGKALNKLKPPYINLSIIAAATNLNIPVSIHISFGTDIIHIHPSFDGAATGQASHNDFKLLINQISQIKGGVFLNLGSAVNIPEVFLKALNAARNLGYETKNFTTINIDMLHQYRAYTNIVKRPILTGGHGISITGHHEIIFPLLIAIVYENINIK